MSLRQLVAVVDYGMGNLRSVSQAVTAAAEGLQCQVDVVRDPQALRQADRLILPGQGAMPDCMAELQRSGMKEALLEAMQDRPLLGICVGLQMLLERSEEGPCDGLGVLPGQVKRFRLTGQTQPDGSRYKIPQMGWNQVRPARPHPIWEGIEPDAWFYFVHSFHAVPSDPEHVAAQTDYGGLFCSAVAHGHWVATQFHPEKSAQQGLTLFRNFLQWNP